jgi:hypothetical protein
VVALVAVDRVTTTPTIPALTVGTASRARRVRRRRGPVVAGSGRYVTCTPGEGCPRRRRERSVRMVSNMYRFRPPRRCRGQGDAGVLPRVERVVIDAGGVLRNSKTLPKHADECGERYRSPSRGSAKRFCSLNRLGAVDQRRCPRDLGLAPTTLHPPAALIRVFVQVLRRGLPGRLS